MEFVLTGNIVKEEVLRLHPNARFYKTLRAGCTLFAGTTCNDGRPISESALYKEAVLRGIPIVSMEQAVGKESVKQESDNQELWADKYAPTSLSQVIGHKDSISQLSQWLSAYPSVKAALIIGPPGIGKTTTAHLVAKAQGYTVVEYNASDTRSVAKLRGLFALGMKRLRKELIIMDEIDGFTAQDRGGVGELADLIRKANAPIICIGNQMAPKLAPLQKVCVTVKFSRPVKSTIASVLVGVCQKEGIAVSKADVERMCETSGNDIRSVLHALQFQRAASDSNKDASLRLDLFSATQKLMSNKRATLHEADDFVYVDYGMVPLMVQEAYLAASRTLEEAVAGSEQVSFGDMVSTRQWKAQDWSLLPHVVHSTVAVSRKVTGPCPFQIFPRLLGQNSKRGKHRRWMEDVGRARGLSAASVRLNEVEYMQRILLSPLLACKGDKGDKVVIQGVIGRMDAAGITRDQLTEIGESVWNAVDVPSKLKTALTREYNKGHAASKRVKEEEDEGEEDEIQEEDEVQEEE
jgi:replication factor C subunit 1